MKNNSAKVIQFNTKLDDCIAILETLKEDSPSIKNTKPENPQQNKGKTTN